MTTWKIKINNKFYAKFKFDKKLVLVEQSDQARIDGLQNKLDKEYEVFDPRNQGMRRVTNPKDKWDADLYLSEVFHSQEFSKYSEGLDWSKVLEPDKPDIVH